MHMKEKLLEFVSKIPKSDLHVHLDGSVRIETLIDLTCIIHKKIGKIS